MTVIGQVSNRVGDNKIFVKKESTSQESKSSKSVTTKVLVGTGLAALASVGIYLATKGKKPLTFEKIVKKGLPDKMRRFSIDEFKKQGCVFKKGKAYNPDGSAFTGKITHKKGVMEYENGVLKSATINRGKYIPSKTKEYSYYNNELSAVNCDGERILTINRSYTKDGRFTNVERGDVERRFLHNNKGQLIQQDIYNNGNIKGTRIHYNPDTKQVVKQQPVSKEIEDLKWD